jgi:hypothetical protein
MLTGTPQRRAVLGDQTRQGRATKVRSRVSRSNSFDAITVLVAIRPRERIRWSRRSEGSLGNALNP